MTLLLTAAGCWNRKEPESLALVVGMGFNYDRQSKEYEAVVNIAKPAAIEGGGGDGRSSGGGQEDGSFVTSAKGKNIFEALRKIEPVVSRELFWGHSEEVIISEDLARRGIQPVLDFYSRERESRLSNFMLATDNELKDLLQVKLPLEKVAGVGIRRQIQTVQITQSVIPFADVRMVLIDLNRPGREIFVPRIRLKKEQSGQGGQTSSGGASPEGGGGQPEESIEIAGGAAFRGDRFAGWVDPVSTQGWLYITGRPSRATEILPCPNFKCDQHVAVEIHRVFRRLEVAIEDGKPQVKVVVSVEGRLQQKDCPDQFTKQYVDKLHSLLAERVRQKAEKAVNRAKQLRSDIFGFGNAVYRKYPREWDKLKDDWEEHFTRLEVEIEVKAHIRRPGMVVDPAGP
ncbi:MAG TPA: Ger(x)C family spore germination protein [Firmicutes bacterium]|nr:Ger(x)C family spore germination protein [Bacillota bacterium]